MHTSAEALGLLLMRTNQIILRAQQFRISRFTRIIMRDGLVALFHQLHPQPVYLPESTWQDFPERAISGMLSPRMSELVGEVFARGLFISNPNVDDDELSKARAQAARRLDRPTILYLMMAQGCNFACTPCPIPMLAKRHGENLLSLEDAIAGIELWRRNIEQQPKDDDPYFLIFYGGEPLLNRYVLEKLLSHVSVMQKSSKLPEKLEILLTTNGSLIDEQFARLLALYRVTAVIGIDGPREHNDRFRLTAAGAPTFSGIEEAIRLLVKEGVRVAASVMITPANVDHLAGYPSFLRELGVSQFGFNLMKGQALNRELSGMSAEEYCRKAAKGVLQGLGEGYEYQLEKRLAALQNSEPFSVDCTCYGNQLVIQADGQVTNCPFLRLDQGQVRRVTDILRIGQTETVQTWRSRLPIFNDSILTSSAIDVLDGGGCAWSSKELYGSIVAHDALSALFTKEVTHELIWSLLPRDQADALRGGESSHWSYRRIGSL